MENRFIDIHTHRESTDGDLWSVVSVDPSEREAVPVGFFTVGVHPWNAVPGIDADLSGYFDHPGLFGIGEIGIDKLRNADNRASQLNLFQSQLDITVKRNLPVVLHCVKAYGETIAALKEKKIEKAIFHGFTGSPELAARIRKEGWYISVGERSMRSERTGRAVADFPMERIFLETDDSGGDIRDLYREFARLRNEPLTIVKEIIYQNFLTLKPEYVCLA